MTKLRSKRPPSERRAQSASAEAISERTKGTRQKLLQAARELFTEKGYHETRPQDIVRRAGVGHGTFYLHFTDKRACFLAFADEAANEIDAIVEAKMAGASSVADLLIAVLDAVRDFAHLQPGVLAAALADPDIIDRTPTRIAPRLADRWASAWMQHLGRLQAEGKLRQDLDLLIIGHALVGLIHQVTTTQERGLFEREQMVRAVIAFVREGLETDAK